MNSLRCPKDKCKQEKDTIDAGRPRAKQALWAELRVRLHSLRSQPSAPHRPASSAEKQGTSGQMKLHHNYLVLLEVAQPELAPVLCTAPYYTA